MHFLVQKCFEIYAYGVSVKVEDVQSKKLHEFQFLCTKLVYLLIMFYFHTLFEVIPYLYSKKSQTSASMCLKGSGKIQERGEDYFLLEKQRKVL